MESANGDLPIESPWDLVKILLSPKTLPHVFLLIAGTGGLFALVSIIDNDPGFAAIIFTSAMLSYILLGIFGNKPSIFKWLQTSRYSTSLGRIVGPLTLPISLMGIISSIILLTVGGDKQIRDIWAVSLASLFIFWSIGQGLALRSSIRDIFVRSKSSKNSEKISPTNWDLRRLYIGALIFCASIAILRGGIIPNSLGSNSNLISWLFYFLVCFSIIVIFLQIAKDRITPFDTSWTKGDRIRVHRTSQVIMLLIAWHISSAWSRLSGSSSGAILIEEVILVILTVVSAVWAMSNKNRSNIQFISKDTAILWAIAFGFGYAGSITVISGLTESFLGDISETLGVGHVLTAVTLLIGFNGSISRPNLIKSEEE